MNVGDLANKIRAFWKAATNGFFGESEDFLDAESIDRFFSSEEYYRSTLTHLHVSPTPHRPTIQANHNDEGRVDWAREGF